MKILMVCLGNICRSPLADALLRKKVQALGLDVEVDSAGTSGAHEGEAPDERMIETAREFGLDISSLRSRPLTVTDLEEFDEIIVMDRSNRTNVLRLANSSEQREKVRFLLDESFPGEEREVPDPYFGGRQGFIDVYKMVDRATDRLAERLADVHEKR